MSVPVVQSMKLRAELARRGLLTIQLQSYWSPDTDSTVDPKRDPETVACAFEFAQWVEQQTENWAMSEPEDVYDVGHVVWCDLCQERDAERRQHLPEFIQQRAKASSERSTR